MKFEHLRVKKLAEDFISESIKSEDPSGLCFATSYPLKIYLLTKNVNSKLIAGKVPKSIPEDEHFKFDHFWLQIDKEGTMLDPTIKQFSGDDKMQIYLGKLDENVITKSYIVSEIPTKDWFQSVYNSWSTPFIDPTYPCNDFTQRSIAYQIKLATILHSEMNRLPNPDENLNRYYRDYFDPIFIFLRNWKIGNSLIKIDAEKIHPDFDKMLAEALKLAND